jgi:hypothetical protein
MNADRFKYKEITEEGELLKIDQYSIDNIKFSIL